MRQFCEGDFATFESVYPADLYIWNFNGAIANPGNVQAVTNQFNTPGFYSITMSIISDCCGLSPSRSVFLYVLPNPAVTGSGDISLCDGESGILSLNGLNATDSVVWSPMINSTPLSNASIQVTPLVTTTYIATIYSTNNTNGQNIVSCPVSISFLVTVNPLPNSTMSSTNVICTADGTATATPANPGTYNFVWGTGATANATSTSTITNLTSTNYPVTVTDVISGCSVTDSVDVFSSASVPLVYINAITQTCEGFLDGGATTATSGGTAPYTYTWSTGTVGSSIIGLAGGDYSVTVVDGLGCSSTVDFNIPENHAPDADVTTNGPICMGDSAVFWIVGHDNATLIYNFGGPNSTLIFTKDTMEIVLYNVTNDTTINLVSIDDGQCTTILGLSDSVVVLPIPAVTLTSNNPICQGNDAIFSLTGTAGTIINYTLDGIPNQNITLTGGTDNITVTNPLTDQMLILDSINDGSCIHAIADTTIVIVNPNISTTENVTVCENTNYTYPDGTMALITANTSHVSNLTMVSGCDSIITTNITMNPVYSIVDNINACENSNYTYPDGTTQVITANISHISSLTTTAGCDSVITTNITMLPDYAITVNPTICDGANYTYPDGVMVTITANTSHISNITTSAGCDSIITTNITMAPTYTAVDNIDLCENTNHTYPDGFTEVITGNTSHISNLLTVNGCDSIITTNITMLPIYAIVVNADICNGVNYTYPDGTTQIIVANTSHISNLTTVAGCDSVITTNITMVTAYALIANIDACENSNYTFPDGLTQIIIANTSHISNLTTVTGCDSIITTNINMLPSYAITVNEAICDGANYTYPDGVTETIIGNTNHVSNLVTIAGCDSIITTNITMNPTYTLVTNIGVCENANHTYPDGFTEVITGNTSYTSNIFALNGCDSIITTNITMLTNYVSIVDTTICEETNYTYPDGLIKVVMSDTSHISNLMTVAGCDSIITTNITIIPIYSNIVDTSVCEGTNYTYPDGTTQLIVASTSYASNLLKLNGCDSIITTNINMLPSYSISVDTVICDGENYTYPDGTIETIIENTNQVSSFLTATGCDSIITTNITMGLLPIVNAGTDQMICDGDLTTLTASNPSGSTITWDNGVVDGTSFTPIITSLYTVTATSNQGCISSDDITVTVNPNPTADFSADILSGC